MPRRLPAPIPFLALALLAGPLAVRAAEPVQKLVPKMPPAEVIQALRKGGYVILFRHASTERAEVDDDFVVAAECKSQRNLSAQGRAEAEAIGRAFQALQIPVEQVLTSPYCRCVEMGELAFGRGEVSQLLAPEGEISGEERGLRIRELLGTKPAGGGNNVLISHTAALLYSFGLQTTPEGIAHVFRPNPVGPPTYVGFVTPADWQNVAPAPADGS